MWLSWPEWLRQAREHGKTPTSHYLISNTIGGSGQRVITAEEAEGIRRALSDPPDIEALRKAYYDRAGYCVECGKYYCDTHWSLSVGGWGTCPNGHGKSLDPHWSPFAWGDPDDWDGWR